MSARGIWLASVTMPGLPHPSPAPEYWPTTVFFAPESAQLDADARRMLEQFVRERQAAAAGCAVRITGFSDAVAFEPDGARIAASLARQVRAALIRLHVPAGAIRVAVVGANEPLVDQEGRMPEPQRRVRIFWEAPCA